jgi:hypothetical protein
VKHEGTNSLPLPTLCAVLNATQLAAHLGCRRIMKEKEESVAKTINLKRLWVSSIDVYAAPCETTSGRHSIALNY